MIQFQVYAMVLDAMPPVCCLSDIVCIMAAPRLMTCTMPVSYLLQSARMQEQSCHLGISCAWYPFPCFSLAKLACDSPTVEEHY